MTDKKFASVDLAPNGNEYNLITTEQDWTSMGKKAAEIVNNYLNNKLKTNHYLVNAKN